jgi:hypothetical protein
MNGFNATPAWKLPQRNFFTKWTDCYPIRTSFFLSGLILLVSCGEKIRIDNPGPETWVFQLDGATHRINPVSMSEVRLEKGTHTLSFPAGSGADTVIPFQVSGEIFLHAPGGRYLLWKDLYGSQAKRNTLLNEQEFEWDSILYKVDVAWLDTTRIIHPVTWEFGIGESFDDKILLGSHQDEAVKVRLLRIGDFATEYQKRAAHK